MNINETATLEDILKSLQGINNKLANLDTRLIKAEQNQNQLERDLFDVLKTVSNGQNATNTLFSDSLRAVNGVVEEMEKLKERLAELGYSLPFTSYEEAIQRPYVGKEDSARKVISMLADLFGKDDLEELIYEAGINMEITANTSKLRAVQVVEHSKRTSKYADLVITAAKMRPHVEWPFNTGWLENGKK